MIGSDVRIPTMLLVHGAWHGAWCWDLLRPELEALGRPTRTVDLPSGGRRSDLRRDAEAVLDAVGAVDGPVVIVAHSYGAVPVTQAVADATRVTRIVYLAGYQLDVGESVFGFHDEPVPDDADGFLPVPSDAISMFYADVPPERATAAVARLVQQSLRPLTEPLTRAAWRTVPSTYIVCERDRALSPQSQEQVAARSDAVYRLASSHSPFLSTPGELAGLLARIAV